MTFNVNGNILYISLAVDEIDITITMPDGYSDENISILYDYNISRINECAIFSNVPIQMSYPPVSSKSPSTIKVHKRNSDENADLSIIITKFGQIPDAHYFDKAFEPILVTGDDGNEYNVIPSDQFK